MKLYVPSIGDKLLLTKDFTFTIVSESRNFMFMERYGFPNEVRTWNRDDYWKFNGKPVGPVTIPKGCTLTVSRIYIRQGKKDYDSITFSLIPTPEFKKKLKGPGARFWVQLDELNDKLEFTKVK